MNCIKIVSSSERSFASNSGPRKGPDNSMSRSQEEVDVVEKQTGICDVLYDQHVTTAEGEHRVPVHHCGMRQSIRPARHAQIGRDSRGSSRKIVSTSSLKSRIVLPSKNTKTSLPSPPERRSSPPISRASLAFPPVTTGGTRACPSRAQSRLREVVPHVRHGGLPLTRAGSRSTARAARTRLPSRP